MKRKTFFTALIMHFILFANLGFTQSVNCNLEEWVALRVLYGSTDGDNWTNNTGWEIVNTSTIPQFCNLNSLYGVTTRNVCAIEDVGTENCIFPQGVIDISLENNNLNGAIPPLIANLFFLESLKLSGNSLTGSLPKEIGILSNLKYLATNDNKLDGCYDEELKQLCNQLINTDFSGVSEGNNFDASFEDFCEINLGICASLPPSTCRQTDSLALIEIYISLNADPLVDFSQPMDNWFGITLNENGCVDKLELNGLNLNGEIPPEIGDLGEITVIDLSNNNITATLPSEIGNLITLVDIVLGGNNFTGTLPSSIGNLINLSRIEIDGNQFTEIPESIGNLSQLIIFSARDNNISFIPETIGELSNLNLLFLDFNNLTELPSSLQGLNLFTLFVNDNQITGPLPVWLAEMGPQFTFQVHNNQFSGCYAEEFSPLCIQIPPFFNSNANISDGNNFDVSWEDFCATGAGTCVAQQPESCQQTDSLALLSIYESLYLYLDDVWDLSKPMDTWKGVSLNENGCVQKLEIIGSVYYGAELSPQIGGLQEVEEISLWSTGLFSLPTEIGNLSTLKRLSINDNPLTTLPPTIGNLSNLEFLDVSNNFSITLPSSIGNLSKLIGLDASYSGAGLPSFLKNLKNLQSLSVEENLITGELPVWLAELEQLTDLNVSYNQLSGCYSTELGKLCGQLSDRSNKNASISDGNNFDASWEEFCATEAGSCTPSLPSCRQTDSLALIEIYKSLNADYLVDFSQRIDDWYGVSLNENGCVEILSLFSLDLDGELPQEIGDLSELVYLNLMFNNISGSIPSEIGNLENLVFLSLDYNNLEGPIPATIGNLNNLLGLYISENQLTGPLPIWLSEMQALIDLRVENNQLSGCYGDELKQLCNESFSYRNSNISNGNNFDATWEDFCATRDGSCVPQPPSCRQTDSLALVKVFKSLGVEVANDSPIDFWPGVYLNENGCVDQLTLPEFLLQGEINPAIGDLSEITGIDLNGNSITGAIPSKIGNLTNLQYLRLAGNQLESIPAEIGNLKNLDFLELVSNKIREIPTSIGNLSKLQHLDLGYNQITHLPESIGNLTNLATLYLDYNSITRLPETMGNLKQLIVFFVNNNEIQGELPSWLASMEFLEEFYINNNQLSGCYDMKLAQLCIQLPFFYSYNISDDNNFNVSWEDFCANGAGSCTSPPVNCRQTDSLALIAIYQSLKPNNNWDLSKPVENWPGVRIINENGCVDKLDLSERGLSGVIPPEIGDLSEITFLRMVENEITGFLPAAIGNLTNLKVLSLADNNMSGSIPGSLKNLTNLEALYLSQNQFTDVPLEIGNFDKLTELFLSKNQLSGCYPSEFLQLCDQLIPNSNSNFAISDGNNFNATWEDFCVTGNGSCTISQPACRQTDSLALLKIYQSLKPDNTWDFSQSMDKWRGVKLNENGCVHVLDLYEDGLNGTIPAAIGDLSEIKYLYLTENKLTGNIPFEIGMLSSLEVLDLHENQLTGSLPESIGKLNNLNSLTISQNQFTELLPSIGNLTNLKNLYLFDNQFSGCFPDEYKQLCDQLNANNNWLIEEGNNFDISWADFCAGYECLNLRNGPSQDYQNYKSYNYPNPFTGQTNINFVLSTDSRVSITIYNAIGNEVAELVDNQMLEAGEHQVIYTNKSLPAGVYYYDIRSKNFSEVKKIVCVN